MTMDEYFRHVSEEGLEMRLETILRKDDPEYDQKQDEYYKRLKFEPAIITQMGPPGHSLIVMDLINWAQHIRVPVGPGRGSGAGSLVRLLALITGLVPLKYD